jgi:hypothetical protein
MPQESDQLFKKLNKLNKNNKNLKEHAANQIKEVTDFFNSKQCPALSLNAEKNTDKE